LPLTTANNEEVAESTLLNRGLVAIALRNAVVAFLEPCWKLNYPRHIFVFMRSVRRVYVRLATVVCINLHGISHDQLKAIRTIFDMQNNDLRNKSKVNYPRHILILMHTVRRVHLRIAAVSINLYGYLHERDQSKYDC